MWKSNNYSLWFRRVICGVLTSALVFSGSGPYGPVSAQAKEMFAGSDSAGEEGSYVPGEVLVCVNPDMADRYVQNAKIQKGDGLTADNAAGGIEALTAGAALLDMGEDLMDVSGAAKELGLTDNGDADPACGVSYSSDDISPDAFGDEKAVIRLIHSDSLTTQKLMEMYSDYPGVLAVSPNYIIETAEASEDAESIYEIYEDQMSENDAQQPNTPVEPVYAGYGSESDIVSYPDLTSCQYAFTDGPGGINVPGWNDPDKENATGVVAVLDSGVDADNPDLAPVMWDEGLNYDELKSMGGGKYGFNAAAEYNGCPSDDTDDVNSHGTHCAGIIASAWNGFGTSGIANGVRIMAVRHTKDEDGRSYISSTMKGFDYILKAKNAGVNVVCVNCSFGNTFDAVSLLAAKQLGQAGIVTVYASGNDKANDDMIDNEIAAFYDSPSTIIVNALNEEGKKADYSNYGIRSTHIYAPGDRILSTIPMELAKWYDDTRLTVPVCDANGTMMDDRYVECRTYFTQDVNTASETGKVEDYQDIFVLEGTNLSLAAPDPVTAQTVGTAEENCAVALTLTARAPMPAPSGNDKYDLIFNTIAEDPELYVGVYIKTKTGEWKKAGVSQEIGNDYGYVSFPVACGGEDSIYDLDELTIRIVLSSPNGSIQKAGWVAVSRLVITSSSAVPYDFYDGTSMATPAVSGQIAILAGVFADDSAEKRAARVLAGAEFSDEFRTWCMTGGKANVANSLSEDTYTPVLTGFYEDDDALHIKGYFLGTKDHMSVTLAQGISSWSSSDGTLEIREVKGSDPEEVLVSIPEGLTKGEVTVTLTDSSKLPGRQSFSRIFVKGDPKDGTQTDGGYNYLKLPEGMEDGAVCTIFGLDDKVYFAAYDYMNSECETFIYAPSDGTWSMAEHPAIVDSSAGYAVRNGQLLHLENAKGSARLGCWDPVEGERGFCGLITTEAFGRDDILDMYYDGENLIMLRTPAHKDETEKTVTDGPTQLWIIDYYLCRADMIGTLKGSYRYCTITHSENNESGETVKTIYVTGADCMDDSKDRIVTESFVMPAEGEELVTQLNDITPEKGLISQEVNKGMVFGGCGTEDGLFITGVCTADTYDDTGFADITADNFTYDYNASDKLIAGTERLSSRQVVSTTVGAYNGKMYIHGFTAGREHEAFLCIKDAKTLPAYGDEKDPDTDKTVKVKKLTLDKKKLDLECGRSGSVKAVPVFADESSTTFPVYSSSNPLVARVDPYTGEILAGELGNAVITVRCGSKTAKCTVSVSAKDYEPYGLDKTESYLKAGETDLLRLYYCYITGKESVRWVSSDPKTVTVSDGLITARSAGTATVTAIWKSGKTTKEYPCTVTVTGVEVPKACTGDKAARLGVSRSSAVINSGENLQLAADLTGTGSGGRNVLVRSSNMGVVVLDNLSGKILLTPETVQGKKNKTSASFTITGKKPGTAYLIVESFEGEYKDRTDKTPVNRKLIKVTVNSPVRSIETGYDQDNTLFGNCWYSVVSSNAEDALTLRPGSMITLGYDILPKVCTNGNKPKWSVKGSGISVKNGVVTAKSPSKKNKNGEYIPAQVKLSFGSVSYVVDVYVIE